MNYLNAAKDSQGRIAIRVVFAVSALAVATMIVLVALSNSRAQSERKSQVTAEPEGRVATPEFVLKDLSGKQVRLSDYKGRVVVVNFWATWCGPCRTEIPSFVKLREQYHEKGFEIIGISLDEDDPDGVAVFAARLKINYPVVLADMETVEAFGPMNAIPTTFVIDRQGQVQSRHLGMLSFDEVESAIKPLL